jgi:hypothetical protein
MILAIVDRLDERLLIPGRHPVLTCVDREDGSSEIRYRDRLYVIPTDEIVVLPVGNTSAENLAGWIADALLEDIRREFPDVRPRHLEVSVEETPGQSGVVRISASE